MLSGDTDAPRALGKSRVGCAWTQKVPRTVLAPWLPTWSFPASKQRFFVLQSLNLRPSRGAEGGSASACAACNPTAEQLWKFLTALPSLDKRCRKAVQAL
ncbi:hypothetical protein NN561_005964 [Cricetulus griseus]